MSQQQQRQLAVLLLWLLVSQIAATAVAAAAAVTQAAGAQAEAHVQHSSSFRHSASEMSTEGVVHHGRALLPNRCGGGAPAVPQRALRFTNSTKRAAALAVAVVDYDSTYTMPTNVEHPSRSPWLRNQLKRLKAASSVSPAANNSSGSITISATAPRSICPKDKAFIQTGPSRTTCRLVIYNPRNRAFLCTAWFVSPRHVVTAGHCITKSRSYDVNVNNPGFLCCSFNKNRCKPHQTWNLVQWVTTEGYFQGLREDNDGAVIEVEPLLPDIYVRPVLQNITSFSPRVVRPHFVYLDGYPAVNWMDSGCDKVDQTKRYHTRGRVTPYSYQNGRSGSVVSYWGVAGCVGQSGGRVLVGGPTGQAYGLQTYGYTQCVSGYGLTGVTQITLSAEACGVCVSCLMQALISNNDTVGNGTVGNGTVVNGTIGNGTSGNSTFGDGLVGRNTIGQNLADTATLEDSTVQINAVDGVNVGSATTGDSTMKDSMIGISNTEATASGSDTDEDETAGGGTAGDGSAG